MDGDEWRWEPEPPGVLLPDVDAPEDPPEIGRLYGPDGALISVVYADRPPFGFIPT